MVAHEPEADASFPAGAPSVEAADVARRLSREAFRRFLQALWRDPDFVATHELFVARYECFLRTAREPPPDLFFRLLSLALRLADPEGSLVVFGRDPGGEWFQVEATAGDHPMALEADALHPFVVDLGRRATRHKRLEARELIWAAMALLWPAASFEEQLADLAEDMGTIVPMPEESGDPSAKGEA